MRHNQARRSGAVALFSNAKIWTALRQCALPMFVTFAPVLLNGCAGMVSGTTSNSGPVAPVITTQPGNQTVNAGKTATFTVGATGAAPLNYQWNKNGAAISGATS